MARLVELELGQDAREEVVDAAAAQIAAREGAEAAEDLLAEERQLGVEARIGVDAADDRDARAFGFGFGARAAGVEQRAEPLVEKLDQEVAVGGRGFVGAERPAARAHEVEHLARAGARRPRRPPR